MKPRRRLGFGGAERPGHDLWLSRISGVGALVGLALVLVRLVVVDGPLPSLRWLRLLLAGYYDILYWAVATVVALLALAVAGTRVRLRAFIGWCYLAAAVLSLLWAVANVKVVAALGRPLNLQWLYYSDFLQSLDARNAIVSAFSPRLAVGLVLLWLAPLVVAWAVAPSLGELLRRPRPRRLILGGALVCLAVYLPLGHLWVGRSGRDPARLENPVVSFARSVVTARRSPPLFTMPTDIGPDDFAPRAASSPSVAAPSGSRRVTNVVLFVLESVPTAYVDVYGGPYRVTPQLSRWASRSAVFDNIYAPAPGTSYAMIPLLTSTYPLISYWSLTEEYPRVRLTFLSAELEKLGYRTAFFNGADLRFQRADEFLAGRGFGLLRDHRSLPCGTLFQNAYEAFLDGTDDACLVDALVPWLDAAPDRPFLAVLWTMMTHNPYFAAGAEADFGVGDADFNRYLNALRRGDEALGRLLDELERRGLADETLVAVVGDHGEAFGQHGQRTHAHNLYEENVHVPLVLINERLYRGERHAVVGGLVDLAPTLLDQLGLPVPVEWQGRSLFRLDRPPRTYFFAPWSRLLFGYRDGSRKLILDATSERYEVFDLANDAREESNLASRDPALLEEGRRRLAAWVQYQDRFLRPRLAGGDRPPQ